MRIAGHTYPYRDRPLGAALDELASLGLSRVEVWLGHAVDGPGTVGRLLRKRGLEAAAVSAGGFYAPNSDVIPRTFELAETLDVRVVVACVPRPCWTPSSTACPRASRSAWRITGTRRSPLLAR